MGTPAEPDATDACVFRRGECKPGFNGMADVCSFEPGSCFYFGTHAPEDDMQTPLPPATSRPASPPLPPGAPVPTPTAAPAATFTPSAPTFSPSPIQAPAQSPPAFLQPTGATVGTPDTAGSDLSKLMPANGQGNGVTLVLALLAVAGGGAAWKFYSQRSRERHEQSMKEIELRATANDQQRQKCDASAATAAAAVKDLGARCDDLARKVADQGTVIESINKRVIACEEITAKTSKVLTRTDDIEDRLEAVERKSRRAAKDET